MSDREEMIKQILGVVRSDRSLWPKEYSDKDAEHYLSLIDELLSPSLNSKGFSPSEEDYYKAKDWAQRVLDIYIQKNPFQGAFVKPLAVNLLQTLEAIWKKRVSQDKNGSWL